MAAILERVPGVDVVRKLCLKVSGEPAAEYILNFLVNKKLSFDYLGHDITGKLISDAYFNGVRLQELNYYCLYGVYPYCYEYYYYPGYYYSGYSGSNYYMSYGY